MKQSQQIINIISRIPEKEIIFASELYRQFEEEVQISEENFYKILERLVTKGDLVRLSKGIYTKPKLTRFGYILPTESEIILVFVEDDSGMVTGYHLFNKLKLTTQIAKNYQVFTNNSHNKSTINNISIKEYQLTYTPSIKKIIAFLEVLASVDRIQDLNEDNFVEYCKHFASYEYQDDLLELVQKEIKYKKSTLYFLKLILDAYEIPNRVHTHLSKLSKYKEPKVRYYEAA